MNKGTSYRPIRQIRFSVSDFSCHRADFFHSYFCALLVLSGCKKKGEKVAVLICLFKVFILNFNCRAKERAITAFTLCEGFVPDLRGVYKFLSELASAFSAQRPFLIKKTDKKNCGFFLSLSP